jgi:hypothetical protein
LGIGLSIISVYCRTLRGLLNYTKGKTAGIQDVSKRALQCYSKCYCAATVTKTFTLRSEETIHRSKCWRVDSLYAFKSKPFRNTSHGVTFGITL